MPIGLILVSNNKIYKQVQYLLYNACIFREKSRAFKVGRSKDTINLCYARNALFLN